MLASADGGQQSDGGKNEQTGCILPRCAVRRPAGEQALRQHFTGDESAINHQQQMMTMAQPGDSTQSGESHQKS